MQTDRRMWRKDLGTFSLLCEGDPNIVRMLVKSSSQAPEPNTYSEHEDCAALCSQTVQKTCCPARYNKLFNVLYAINRIHIYIYIILQ